MLSFVRPLSLSLPYSSFFEVWHLLRLPAQRPPHIHSAPHIQLRSSGRITQWLLPPPPSQSSVRASPTLSSEGGGRGGRRRRRRRTVFSTVIAKFTAAAFSHPIPCLPPRLRRPRTLSHRVLHACTLQWRRYLLGQRFLPWSIKQDFGANKYHDICTVTPKTLRVEVGP